MRKVLSIICSFAFLFSLTYVVCEATIYNTYVTRVQQAKSNWCWAACSEMVASSQTYTGLDQYDAAVYIHGGEYNLTATLAQTESAVEYLSDYEVSYLKGATLTLTATKRKIQSGYPIIAGLALSSSSTTGHMVVIDMFNDTNNKVSIWDPSPLISARYWYDYDALVDGSAVNINGTYMMWIQYISVSGFAPGV